ncbi:hypothetical protein EVAR_2489_1 [Eumeta japonica]|uniref:Uncharacterized protein n=1 Tax=Eumeta variegata TaxID=151549 RepID=A0A4C1SRB6_EUMVA|nr:hypothetical protein EVAR_2489_1 [Eumeta japonica]
MLITRRPNIKAQNSVRKSVIGSSSSISRGHAKYVSPPCRVHHRRDDDERDRHHRHVHHRQHDSIKVKDCTTLAFIRVSAYVNMQGPFSYFPPTNHAIDHDPILDFDSGPVFFLIIDPYRADNNSVSLSRFHF